MSFAAYSFTFLVDSKASPASVFPEASFQGISFEDLAAVGGGPPDSLAERSGSG